MYHRVTDFDHVLTVVYTTWWGDPVGPIPAPHLTLFVVLSDELPSLKYGRFAIGVENHILIPSEGIYTLGDNKILDPLHALCKK